MAKRKVVRKKVVKKNIAKGIIYISATFNNTVVTVTDEMGNVIAWSSAGSLGFKGSKKSTPYAAQQAVEDALTKAKEHGLKEIGIKVQGPGSGRETAVKSAGTTEGIKVSFLKDITPLPHNGCRPPKRRRV
ncbi:MULTISPECIES: 30S ribosomal protein S11 [Sulfurospirillum]|jgi:small subunit ribosomal protein S11|uniref:Small ribosomal subunit protein uS11 n=5 Tax=Sulfurospirillum TaxID=57665 RepID=A0A1Y0HQ29_9BACT|nr:MULTISPECIES: 30S ribosomal protein S11 [Sulfurospirillum]MBN1839112.1 30S ribosomal protein S11 [Campylobacterales bacterium]MBP9565678.1 30S ribosomal protein S11 [Sulfurospirillum sp.]NCD11946.1 30S ribosomal protein S11 [Campylobacterota bacterium]AFL69338.1 SSU ribosomal protein S11P [Sulfurospirillum barnesii SES-3]AHJ13921.1 SSU ribosomal protein S11p (S14e) [Sulfurospirillum multivorans DSM 12446]